MTEETTSVEETTEENQEQTTTVEEETPVVIDYDSILTSVKKMLGISYDYTHFDADIIFHINTVFGILTQMGIGPKDGFTISSSDDQWSSFLTSNDKVLEMVKSYMYMKVRSMFDPPTMSSVSDSLNRMISELEWRLYTQEDLKEV